MIGLNHALTGALVAVAVDQPIVSLPAAFLSHFVIDSLPHWNYQIPGRKKLRPIVIGVDMILSTIGIALIAVFVDADFWLFFLGGLLGILPDTMWLPYILTGKPTPKNKNNLLHVIRRFHFKIQWSESYKGAVVELAWLVMLIFFTLNLT